MPNRRASVAVCLTVRGASGSGQSSIVVLSSLDSSTEHDNMAVNYSGNMAVKNLCVFIQIKFTDIVYFLV